MQGVTDRKKLVAACHTELIETPSYAVLTRNHGPGCLAARFTENEHS